MLLRRETIHVSTRGRGAYEITGALRDLARDVRGEGMCHLFAQHTSASLIICENADPQVLRDLENFLARLAPDGDPLFRHDAEGGDDMPAHVRSVLTQTSLSLPLAVGKLLLGAWQGVYLYEHRLAPHRRQVIATLWGTDEKR
ncbi:MAG TPA: secondary thiamine-phosphate synthase enzyme YjbQ [Gammaproteobacteria bacterium]|nr:secondary thiamine-phosphate synthase enzyme YjbQ [Gammaproteobacteria bacterium]